MKRSALLILVLGVALLWATSAPAATFTLSLNDLNDTTNFVYEYGSNSSLTSRTLAGGYVTFNLNASAVGNKAGIGDGYDLPSDNAGLGIPSALPTNVGFLDLTNYGYYALTFHNPNANPIHVNPFMNTGWTDAAPSQPDYFYQNGWTYLGGGQTTSLTINFASADTYLAGASQGFTTVVNRNYTSNIGFQVVLDDASGNFGQGTGNFSVDVAPIPLPASILLMGSGLLGLVGLGWRVRKS